MKAKFTFVMSIITMLSLAACGSINNSISQNEPTSLDSTPTKEATPNREIIIDSNLKDEFIQNGGGENNMININITIGDSIFSAKLYDNETARDFAARLPMMLKMSELNGNEKFYNLSERLPTDSERIGSINAGDLMLYGSDCLVLFYKSFSTSYSYTKLGYIEDASGLSDVLGSKSVQVEFDFNEGYTPSDVPKSGTVTPIPTATLTLTPTPILISTQAMTSTLVTTSIPTLTPIPTLISTPTPTSTPTLTQAPIITPMPNLLLTPTLSATPTPTSTPAPTPMLQPTSEPTIIPELNEISIIITVGSSVFSAMVYNNSTTKVLLEQFPMTLSMSELNGNEKYHYLPNRLSTDSEQVGSIKNGDLMLYGSDCLVLFYKSFSTSYSYTRLGYIKDASGLSAALGNGSVEVSFSISD